MTEKPCHDCGTTKRDRSACPLCGRVLCQRCAEKPYESCCDGEPLATDLTAALEAKAKMERELAQLSERVTTIVDEECSMQPVTSPQDLLTLLERHLFERRRELETAKAELQRRDDEEQLALTGDQTDPDFDRVARAVRAVTSWTPEARAHLVREMRERWPDTEPLDTRVKRQLSEADARARHERRERAEAREMELDQGRLRIIREYATEGDHGEADVVLAVVRPRYLNP